jgi:small-conductance mechanosensitive channel
MIAVSAAGIDLSKFALLAGALGVGIGFGLQNIVNNFISGLILIFERPIQIGDVIELSELRGTVNRIGIRSSTIRTFSGAEVIVPNANLISNEVVNWTLSDKMRRIEIPVGVAYGSDPNQVLGILKTLARNHESVLKVPEPFVLFRGFGDSSLDFELRFWTGDFNTWMELQTQVTLLVHDALKGAGIEIPFPQRDLHIKSSDMLQKFVKPVSSTEDQDNLSEKKNAPEKDPASEA